MGERDIIKKLTEQGKKMEEGKKIKEAVEYVSKRLERELMDMGYYFVKDYFMWGRTPLYRNKENAKDVLFVDFVEPEGYKVLTPAEMLRHLLKTWRPPEGTEEYWAAVNLRGDFKDQFGVEVPEKYIEEEVITEGKRIYLEPDDPAVKFARMAFPGYKGRTFSLRVEDGGMSLQSYWDGGSRDYYKVIRLADQKVVSVPESGTPFTGDIDEFLRGKGKSLPCEGYVVVEHTFFTGKDMGITIHVHPTDMPKFISAPAEEVSKNERIVLKYTQSIKSGFRYQEAERDTGISKEDWEAAKQSCIAKGWLNKMGAITTKGKNIIAGDY